MSDFSETPPPPKPRVPRPIGFAVFLGVLGIAAVYATGKGGFMNTSSSQLVPAEITEALSADASAVGIATFGSGCFWCTEAIYQRLNGVTKVVSGYSGGDVANPTYELICGGDTGHAEAIQVSYDPKVVSYAELLEIFWQTHDPTTLNRQGADVGTQYRSIVFYHNDSQRQVAEHYKKKLDESGVFTSPIVTQIEPIDVFYPAENYHQNYFNDNPYQPYCLAVVRPKVEKFQKVFHGKLKPAEEAK